MTQEEKAKAYDEALEKIKVLQEDWKSTHNRAWKEIEEVFPQLADSEDERIRKALIGVVSDIAGGYPFEAHCITKKEAVTYLEKQKELFESGRGLYYYDGEKTTYWSCPATEENPHDFAMSPQEKQKEQKSLNIRAASEWLRKHVRNYINSEYNEFHKCVEFDGSIDEEKLINDFEEAMQKEKKSTEQNSEEMFDKIDDSFRRGREVGFREGVESVNPTKWSEEYREDDLRTRFAFYTYKDEDGVLYLSNVFVEEASRNKGFGTKILIAAEKVAETIGAISIRLKVKQNSPANGWYRRRGYGYMAFENGYDWLEKNLEYLKPQPKVEWSEKKMIMSDTDKSNLRDVPAIIRSSNHPFKENMALLLEKYIKR